jgi:hypothetical protein
MKHVLKTLIALSCVCNPSWADDNTQFDEMRTVLLSHFPDYDEIVGTWNKDYVSSMRSPDNFVNDILVGDFNSDDISDFAAMLRRPLSTDEIAQISERHRDRITTTYVIVVCDGYVASPSKTGYRCYEIGGPKTGGIQGSLDYMDWEWYLSTLREGEYPACEAAIQTRVGMKSLSLMQPLGLCDVFFHPKEDGGYLACMFCAD